MWVQSRGQGDSLEQKIATHSNGTPLQCSCLENPMDGGAWWAAVHRVAKGGRSSIPALGRSPGVGNGNPLQYSCLENVMDIGVWWAIVHGVIKGSDTNK